MEAAGWGGRGHPGGKSCCLTISGGSCKSGTRVFPGGAPRFPLVPRGGTDRGRPAEMGGGGEPRPPGFRVRGGRELCDRHAPGVRGGGAVGGRLPWTLWLEGSAAACVDPLYQEDKTGLKRESAGIFPEMLTPLYFWGVPPSVPAVLGNGSEAPGPGAGGASPGEGAGHAAGHGRGDGT